MKNQTPIRKQMTYWLSIAIIGLITGIGLQFAQAAWTNPTTTAPGGNVAGPLTTATGSQWKTGPLGINTGSAPLAGFGLSVGGSAAIGNTLSVGGNISSSTQISSPRYCIGSSCITTWPSGGVADNLGNHTATQDLNMNGRNILNGGNRVSMGGIGSASYYYGDSTNLAARQNGAFYVQNAAGTAAAPIRTGTLNVSGNGFVSGKMYSAVTAATDASNTLVTKGYVDSKLAGMFAGTISVYQDGYPSGNANTGAQPFGTALFGTIGNLGIHKFCATGRVQNGWNTSIGNNWGGTYRRSDGSWTGFGASDNGYTIIYCID